MYHIQFHMSRVLLPVGKGENLYGQPYNSRQKGEVLYLPHAYHHSRNHLLCQRLRVAGISDSNLRMNRNIGGGIPPPPQKGCLYMGSRDRWQRLKPVLVVFSTKKLLLSSPIPKKTEHELVSIEDLRQTKHV